MFKPTSKPTGPPVLGKPLVLHEHEGEEAAVEVNEEESVRRCYEEERRLWESMKAGRVVLYRAPASYGGTADVTVDGKLRLQKGRRSEWRHLLSWCRQHQVPVNDFIRAMFTLRPYLADRAPEPPQLCTDTCYKLWRGIEDKLDTAIRVELKAQAAEAESLFIHCGDDVTVEAAWAEVLQSSAASLSPLFRYSLAVEFALTPIVKRYIVPAIMQFHRHAELYCMHWGQVLPVAFGDMAEEAYPGLMREIAAAE